MKEIIWGYLLVGLLGWWEARAQNASGSWAQVYTVTDNPKNGRFQVPQVKLPDAAVALRINEVLMRHFRDRSTGEVDSTRSARQQLRESARQCCFDEDTKSWRAGGDGLTETGYEVLLNQNYLLSLAFADSYNGLNEPSGPHLTFDLRTGHLLTVGDLVATSLTQLSRRLQVAVSRRLRDNLASVVENYGDDSTRIDYVARLYQIETWDTTPQRGMSLDMADGSPGTADDAEIFLLDFALTPDALLLFHLVGIGRINFEFLPDDTYIFPWVQLQLRERLQSLASPATLEPRRNKPRFRIKD